MLKASGSDVRLAKVGRAQARRSGRPPPRRRHADDRHAASPALVVGCRRHWPELRAYVSDHGLGQNDLFWAVAQAVLEMAEPKSRERQLLEAVVAWGRGSQPKEQTQQIRFSFGRKS